MKAPRGPTRKGTFVSAGLGGRSSNIGKVQKADRIRRHKRLKTIHQVRVLKRPGQPPLMEYLHPTKGWTTNPNAR